MSGKKQKEVSRIPSSQPGLEAYFAIADGISSLLNPFVETVVHDLRANTIAHIANPFSPREIGDPSDLNETLTPEARVIGPYESINFNGRRLRSISIVLRDECEDAAGLLCVNMDVTEFEGVQRMLQSFLRRVEPTVDVEAAFHDDWHDKINRFIAAWTVERSTTIDRMGKEDRRQLIETLHEMRGFEGHRAAAYVAKILGVSRATVYNELARLKSRKAA